LLDKDHYLEQGAHVWRTVYVDRANLPVDLHNLAAVHDTVVDDYIEPGKSDVARFNIPLSGYNAATLRVRARLRMRKANQRWTDWLTNFDGGTDPVAEIFTKNLTAPLAGLRWETKKDKSKATPSAPAAPPPIGMVFVPAGKAQIGSDTGDSDEAPAQRLHIDAFYIDRFPITNAQYRRFLRAARQPGPVHKIAWAEKYNWRGQDYPAGTGDQPAILVSWEEAKGYCAWKGKRLPHEVEWEKTARGPNALVWPWGNRWEDGACPELDGVEVPPRVGMCPNRKSVYGAFEMVGGVYEWTADQYYAYDRTHLHRNANEWITVFGDPSLAVRGVPSGQVGPATTAMSRSGHADNMRARIGFRCALSPDKRGLQ
jgi:formylglycine-generating enzyme required for sulfatase activity